MSNTEKSMQEKVLDWVMKEGYPLEFYVANSFRAAGFHTNQGTYARSKEMEVPREIDVSADYSKSVGRSLIRAYHLVECKWTQDKPWVVFTDTNRMHPNAVVVQTIASNAGHSALWVRAPDKTLHGLDCFALREKSGFSGRQAFGSNPDQFYSAVQSIIEKSVAVSARYDEYNYEPSKSMMCVVVFPIVVISGPLFEASYDSKTQKVEIKEVDRVRVLWEGAGKWNLRAVVEVMRDVAVDDFCKTRYKEMPSLIASLEQAIKQFHECFDSKSMTPLEVMPGPRGVLGPPFIVNKIREELSKYEGRG